MSSTALRSMSKSIDGSSGCGYWHVGQCWYQSMVLQAGIRVGKLRSESIDGSTGSNCLSCCKRVRIYALNSAPGKAKCKPRTSGCTQVAELNSMKWFVVRGDRVIRTVRRATSRSLVHSPSNADQIRRVSLWLELGPSLRDATSVSC